MAYFNVKNIPAGRSYSITSQRMLMQCVDSLVLKVQSGVVVNFEKIGPDPPLIIGEGKICHSTIYGLLCYCAFLKLNFNNLKISQFSFILFEQQV